MLLVDGIQSQGRTGPIRSFRARQTWFRFRMYIWLLKQITSSHPVPPLLIESSLMIFLLFFPPFGTDSKKKKKKPLYFVHRVDLHNEIRRLAPGDDGHGGVKPQLHLASTIVGIDADSGTIELADGEIHHTDLIVAADGLHVCIQESSLAG